MIRPRLRSPWNMDIFELHHYAHLEWSDRSRADVVRDCPPQWVSKVFFSFNFRFLFLMYIRVYFCNNFFFGLKMTILDWKSPSQDWSIIWFYLKNALFYSSILLVFLSDPGKPGVRSLGRDVRHYDTFVKLNWCDSVWWRYQLNTNWQYQ